MKRFVLALLCLAACGDDDDGQQPSADADVSPLEFSPCEDGQRLGEFTVRPSSSGSSVGGKIVDHPFATAEPILLGEDGDCQWFKGALYVCDPGCAGMACTAEGTCEPYPINVSVGTLDVNGVEIEADPSRQYNYMAALTAVTAGVAVNLSATGGDLEPFSLRGQGVDVMEVTTADNMVIQSGQAVTVEWTPPTMAGPTKVIVDLNINGHGGAGSQVVCTVDDTGSFTIPAGLVTSLLDDGLSGFPDLTVTRRTVDSAQLAAGCVELRVDSSDTIPVETGVASCNDDVDCPDGMTCQDDLVCE